MHARQSLILKHNRVGYDGTWSPFTVKVGTPPQWTYLLPSTSISETWVIGASGCDGTIQCQTLRGGIFLANTSSTFKSEGNYNLGLDPNLGFSGAGYYGLDSIQLTDSISEKSQVVAIVNETDTWTGILGLGPQGTSFVESSTKPLVASLADGNDSAIPSLSYGFTAGASYRLKQVPGSLTFGGYDAARFEPNNVSFSLDSNQQPTVSLNSIVANGWRDSNVTLLDSGEQGLFTIDSSTPFLWLPEAAAQRFEQTFGLEYNDTLQLYFYPNQTQPNGTLLSDLNACTFDFTFSDLSGSSQTLTLSLVGQTFTSLSLSYGYPNLAINSSSQPIPYFPVRKAANSTQYTIGRMFLQETYLTVDYERNNFSLSQAIFSQDALTNIQLVDILSVNSTSPVPAAAASSSLSTGAIAGIAIGAVCLIVIVLGTIIILIIRKRRASSRSANDSNEHHGFITSILGKRSSRGPLVPEKGPAAEVQGNEIKELHGSNSLVTTEVKELQGRVLIPEMPESPANVVFGVDHDPSTPVELPLRNSADFSRDNDLAPPEYAASSPAFSNASFPNHSPSPFSAGPVSPLNSPLPGSEKGNGAWLDVSSESGVGTNESSTGGRLHPLHPASRNVSRNASPSTPRYVLDESESAHVDLRSSMLTSAASRYSADASRPESEARRFSWEDTG